MKRRPSITLSRKQMENLLTLPEEAEITRKEQKKIIAAALKLWQDGKPIEPDEVIRLLDIPEKVKARKNQLGEVVKVAQEISYVVAKNGKKPRIFLTKTQIFKAVEQLATQEKAHLLKLLSQEQQRVSERFADSVKKLRETYASMPAKKIKGDVAEALQIDRGERRAKRSYR